MRVEINFPDDIWSWKNETSGKCKYEPGIVVQDFIQSFENVNEIDFELSISLSKFTLTFVKPFEIKHHAEPHLKAFEYGSGLSYWQGLGSNF